MKRLLPLPSAFLLIVILSACTNYTATPIEPNENNMIITIRNKANFDFHGLEVAILDHSQGGVNADGSIIENNEELKFEFLREDFKSNGEEVEMEGILLTESNGNRIPINKKVQLELENNKEIVFELTGNSINEAELIREN